jgi:hypothetical protein
MGFQERFATEEACREYLFACRWPNGFRCRRCAGREIGAMHERRRVWQCKRCGAQTSVTAGTVMHNTQTPLRLWFWAAYLVATHHPGISAVQLQRQLGIARHERAWMMLHKLRRAMVAPEREPLGREVEVDEFYLGGYEEGLKGGRARGNKVMCGVAVEVRDRGSGRLRLAIHENASGRSLGGFVTSTTEPGTVVHTDGWQGYNVLPELGYEHSPMVQNGAEPGEEPFLPRAHRDLEPQGVASRHPPPRLTPAPPGLPRRVRLPSQPSRQPARRVPDAARSQHTPRAGQLPPDHR